LSGWKFVKIGKIATKFVFWNLSLYPPSPFHVENPARGGREGVGGEVENSHYFVEKTFSIQIKMSAGSVGNGT